jgi:hypothetical protein
MAMPSPTHQSTRSTERRPLHPVLPLAPRFSAELASGVDPSLLIRDVAPLDHAGPTEISFLDNKKYVDAFSTSKAGACFVHPDLAHRAPSGMALLLELWRKLGDDEVRKAAYRGG